MQPGPRRCSPAAELLQQGEEGEATTGVLQGCQPCETSKGVVATRVLRPVNADGDAAPMMARRCFCDNGYAAATAVLLSGDVCCDGQLECFNGKVLRWRQHRCGELAG